MSQAPTLLDTAYHEAGHAAFRYRWGKETGAPCSFKLVTIEPAEDYVGAVVGLDHRWMKDAEALQYGHLNAGSRRTMESDIMAFFAGMVMDEIRGVHDTEATIQVKAEDIYVGHSSDDLKNAWRIAALLGYADDTTEFYLGWLYRMTRDYLGSGYIPRSVDALAEALLKRPTLRYRQAVEVMDGALSVMPM